MTEILFLLSVLTPIVTGLVQMIKMAVNLPKNWVPVLALFVGLLVGAAAVPFSDLELTMRLWAGALAGLTGVGLYEAIKQQDGQTKDVK